MISIQNNFMQTCAQSVLLAAIAYFAGSKRLIHVFNGSTQMGFYTAASGTAAAAFIQQSVLPSSEEESIFMTTLKKTMCVAIGLAIVLTIGKKLNPKCVLNLTDGLKFGGAELLILQTMQMLASPAKELSPVPRVSDVPSTSTSSTSTPEISYFDEIYQAATKKKLGEIAIPGNLVSYFEGEVMMYLKTGKDSNEVDPFGTLYTLSSILHFTTGQNLRLVLEAFKKKDEAYFYEVKNSIVKGMEIPVREKLLKEKKTYLNQEIKKLTGFGLKVPKAIANPIENMKGKMEKSNSISKNWDEIIADFNRDITIAALMSEDRKPFFEVKRFRALLGHFNPEQKKEYAEFDTWRFSMMMGGKSNLKDSLQKSVIESLTQNHEKRFTVAFLTAPSESTCALIYDRTSKTALLMDSRRNSICLIDGRSNEKNHVLDSLVRFFGYLWPEIGIKEKNKNFAKGEYSYTIAHLDPTT